MDIKLGSKEHKQIMCDDLIKTYYENIWKDEMYLLKLEDSKGSKRNEIIRIQEKIDAKGFKTKNEGEKAKFVAEREVVHIDQEIAKITEQITKTWPDGIKLVEQYLAKE